MNRKQERRTLGKTVQPRKQYFMDGFWSVIVGAMADALKDMESKVWELIGERGEVSSDGTVQRSERILIPPQYQNRNFQFGHQGYRIRPRRPRHNGDERLESAVIFRRSSDDLANHGILRAAALKSQGRY